MARHTSEARKLRKQLDDQLANAESANWPESGLGCNGTGRSGHDCLANRSKGRA